MAASPGVARETGTFRGAIVGEASARALVPLPRRLFYFAVFSRFLSNRMPSWNALGFFFGFYKTLLRS
ncbi:MAG: hypothetical protein Q8P67_03640, partial [archaeon]|nr:hypothetical protein [archaeon]